MDQQWQQEQLRVDHIVAEIDDRVESLKEKVGDVKSEVIGIRKEFWDDVTVNVEDDSEEHETAASVKQQAEMLSERERRYKHAYTQLKTLGRLRQSPYFGRIDFAEEEMPGTEAIYLGIASLLDKNGLDFLIYDWRAPVSSLYYDYPPGEARYSTPSGIIHGNIELKRQYIIRDGRIKGMFDTGVTIGDELLKQVLGKQADSQMKSIVATIQREQNKIIRDEQSRLLIVQGAAGSGKTSAALQRVAYLLYRYRGMLEAEHVLLFSPNPMFNQYVSTVLPDLGEENMQQITYQQYLDHHVNKELRIEEPFSLLEYEHTAIDDPAYAIRMAGVLYKSSLDYMELIKRYVDSLQTSGLLFTDIRFRDEVILSSTWMEQQFNELDPSFSLPNRMEMLKNLMLQQLTEIARQERQKSWVDEELELLDNEEYAWAFSEVMRKGGYSGETFDDFDLERSLLAKQLVSNAFKPIRKQVKQLKFLDMTGMYAQLFKLDLEQFHPARLPKEWEEIALQSVERLTRGELSYEDATPYLDMCGQIEGMRYNSEIRHLFIDEGQDYSPYQFAYLKSVFPRARMTVLGDVNQAIFTHTDAGNGMAELPRLFAEHESTTYILTRSYRSTKPIVEFTRRLLLGEPPIEPFDREGPKPSVRSVADEAKLADWITSSVEQLQREGHESVAIICKTAEESKQAYESLRERLPVRLIHSETVTFEQGIVVIPTYLAKGVEFDAVLIYNASSNRYGRESERKLFYTACTRAMHHLELYVVGEETPFLQDVPEETFDRMRL